MLIRLKLSAVLVVIFTALLFSSLCFGTGVGAADELQDLKDKQSYLEKKQEKLEQEIAAAKKEASNYSLLLSKLKEQTNTTEQQISVLEQKINTLDKSIAEKESQIEKKSQEITYNYELLKQRIRAIYMAGDVTILEVLLTSVDFGDFIAKAELLHSIAKHDNELINKLEADRKSIEDTKKEIEAQREELDADRKELAAKRAELQRQTNENQLAYNKVMQDKAQKEKEWKKYEDEIKQTEKEIERILKERMSKDKYVGGVFAWPVPGYYYISSPYGPRWGSFHYGIDIAGANIYGKNIVAANSGTVIAVRDCGNRSYGKYLIIDHGGGTSTLYAHCSKIVVSEGQKVTKGQVIAKVGSTGNSTGPHLHFEIRINGVRVNPMTQFK